MTSLFSSRADRAVALYVRLRPYAKNARTHSEDQIAKNRCLAGEYGWTAPVMVADDGVSYA